MIEVKTEQCLACGRPLTQLGGKGHRKRRYCDDTCRQRAHRAHKAEEAKAEREDCEHDAQARGLRLEKLEEEKQALLRALWRQAAEAGQWEAQLERLMAENAHLRKLLDLETNYRRDVRQHNFKPWLRKRTLPQGSFPQRFVDDKALPAQASHAHFEQLLRSLHYSDEDVEIFRDLWKAMLLQS